MLTKFLEYMINMENRSERTVIAYCKDIKDYIDFMKKETGLKDEKEMYKAIAPANVDNLTFHMRETFSPNAINRKIASIRKFHKYLSIREGIEDKVTQFLIRSNTTKLDEYGEETIQIEYFTIEEASRLLDSTKNSTRRSRNRDYAMLLTFLLLGIRESELINIKEADIDFKNNSLRVKRKGGRIETLYMDSDGVLARAIKDAIAWKSTLPKVIDDAFVFVSEKTGSMLTGKSVERIVKRACEDAGLRQLSPHKLRHTTATMLFEKGVGLKEIADVLGHKSTRTTEIYAHTTKKRQQIIVNSNPLLNVLN